MNISQNCMERWKLRKPQKKLYRLTRELMDGDKGNTPQQFLKEGKLIKKNSKNGKLPA